jgi:hypothetical protein
MSLDAATSVYLLTNRDTHFNDHVSCIGMMVWLTALLVSVALFGRVAKNRFVIRWSICMVAWGLCWDAAVSFPIAVIREAYS